MTRRPVTIAVSQLNYTLGDFEGNAQLIEKAIEEAGNADLVVFSELCLSGYHPLDLIEEAGFLEKQQRALDTILRASTEQYAALVVGLASRNAGPGKPLRNSLYVIRKGQIVLRYHKQLLPTYDVFDERRYFEPGEPDAAVLELNGHRIGFLICEDAWNDDVQVYAVNPITPVIEAGVDLIVNINASPAHLGKRAWRHQVFSSAAARYGVAVLYSNQVGGNDQLVYDGASFALDRRGALVQEWPLYEPATRKIVFDGDFSVGPPGLQAHAMTDTDFFYRQALLGLQDYVRKTGFKSVVVGSSGGIDSALTLALARDALGSGAVHALTMPSRYSSSGSVDDSVQLSRNLKIPLKTHPIESILGSYEKEFLRTYGEPLAGLAAENVQARIRGTILMEASNQFGHLVLSTGNKSEMSVGYATLYGDMNGGLNLIGDIYKTEVFALARYVNDLHAVELIPEQVLTKAPSAELAADQKDSDSLPPYEVLDVILKYLIEGTRLPPADLAFVRQQQDELKSRGGGELIERICSMVARAEFKRRQAPPIIRMRERAFGAGRQMPIAAKHC